MLKATLYLMFLFTFLSPAIVVAELESGESLRHAIPEMEDGYYVARLSLHTPKELEAALKRVEMFVENGEKYPTFTPITFIIHGPELRVFVRKNYKQYREIVRLAARLEAFNAVDIRVCSVQMQRDGIKMGDLPAFVDPVPYGPDEEQRLLNRGYKYF